MTPPQWAAELVDQFWTLAGDCSPFPRDLTEAAHAALPVSIVPLAGLRISAINAWTARNGVGGAGATPDRPLRACLLSANGGAFIFVDAGDPEAEQRFSLAHELGHFLRDYWQPRERATVRLGVEALEVLDGRRRPRLDERIGAALRGLSLQPFVHLLERSPLGQPSDELTYAAEREADLIAYELLAPAALVRRATAALPPARRRDAARALLSGRFGLPPAPARDYAATLMPISPDTALLTRLRLALQSAELAASAKQHP